VEPAKKKVHTVYEHLSCDICERNLLRGEEPETYVNGVREACVCELCKLRAVQAGWVRSDGTGVTKVIAGSRNNGFGFSLADRIKNIFGTKNSPKQVSTKRKDRSIFREVKEDISREDLFTKPEVSSAPELSNSVAERKPPLQEVVVIDDVKPVIAVNETEKQEIIPSRDFNLHDAIEIFNASDKRRSVSGISRTLGAPRVTVRGISGEQSTDVVAITVAWELSWYRYEVDFTKAGELTVADQGSDMGQLPQQDLLGNASADSDGALSLTV